MSGGMTSWSVRLENAVSLVCLFLNVFCSDSLLISVAAMAVYTGYVFMPQHIMAILHYFEVVQWPNCPPARQSCLTSCCSVCCPWGLRWGNHVDAAHLSKANRVRQVEVLLPAARRHAGRPCPLTGDLGLDLERFCSVLYIVWPASFKHPVCSVWFMEVDWTVDFYSADMSAGIGVLNRHRLICKVIHQMWVLQRKCLCLDNSCSHFEPRHHFPFPL